MAGVWSDLVLSAPWLLENANTNLPERKAWSTHASSVPRDKDQLHDLTLKMTQQVGDKQRENLRRQRSTQLDVPSKDFTVKKTIRLCIQTAVGEMFKEIRDGITKYEQVIRDGQKRPMRFWEGSDTIFRN